MRTKTELIEHLVHVHMSGRVKNNHQGELERLINVLRRGIPLYIRSTLYPSLEIAIGDDAVGECEFYGAIPSVSVGAGLS